MFAALLADRFCAAAHAQGVRDAICDDLEGRDLGFAPPNNTTLSRGLQYFVYL